MKNRIKYRTDFLFTNPTFVMGLGSVFNIAGNYFRFNYSENEEKADFEALKADWGVIGQDIRNASEILKKSSEKDHEIVDV